MYENRPFDFVNIVYDKYGQYVWSKSPFWTWNPSLNKDCSGVPESGPINPRKVKNPKKVKNPRNPKNPRSGVPPGPIIISQNSQKG